MAKEYDRHELLDRTSIIINMIEDYLITHPEIKKSWRKEAERAQLILADLYQEIGSEHFQKDIRGKK